MQVAHIKVFVFLLLETKMLGLAEPLFDCHMDDICGLAFYIYIFGLMSWGPTEGQTANVVAY